MTFAPGQAAEHLVGTDRVQGGEALVDEDGDVHCTVCAVGSTVVGRRESGGGTPPARPRARAGTRGASSRGCRSRRQRRPPRSAPRCPRAAGGRPPAAPARRNAPGVTPVSARKRGRSGAGSCGPARPSPRPSRSAADMLDDVALDLAQRLALRLWAASVALNCDWLPGRRRNSTSGERSAAPRRDRGPPPQARARGPSRRSRRPRSRSARRAGRSARGRRAPRMRAASSAAAAQWVVARRPSSRPAAASRKAPVQTEAVRLAPDAAGDPLEQRAVAGRLRGRPARHDQRVDRRGRIGMAASGVTVRPLEVRSGIRRG